jgi:hypothetical protein
MDGGTELTRAQPPAAPVRKAASQGAGEGEGSAGDPFWGSAKVERQRGSLATVVKVAAGRVSHPKILISECEPFFPQETYNFQKNSFILT